MAGIAGPIIFRPRPPRRDARHGHRRRAGGRQGLMVELPQPFVLWCHAEDTQRFCKGCLVLGMARFVSVTEADTSKVLYQMDLWRKSKRSPQLNGKYVQWSVDQLHACDNPVVLTAEHYSGSPQLITRLRSADVLDGLVVTSSPATSLLIEGDALPVLMRLPRPVVQLLMDGVKTLVTPAIYASSFNVPVGPMEEPDEPDRSDEVHDDVDAEAAFSEHECDDQQDEPSSLQAWRTRGKGWKAKFGRDSWSVLFQLECARLGLKLTNLNLLSDVARMVARMVCPEKDLSTMVFPQAQYLREFVVKMDLLHMLSCRLVYTEEPRVRVARFISPDSSPQGQWDFFCVAEERMTRPASFSIDPENLDPFGGFTWVRRSMVVTTMNKARTSGAMKLQRLAHAAALEAGAENLWAWRNQVKGFLSDQGTERGICSAPFGAADEVADVLKALKENRLQEFEPPCPQYRVLASLLAAGWPHACHLQRSGEGLLEACGLQVVPHDARCIRQVARRFEPQEGHAQHMLQACGETCEAQGACLCRFPCRLEVGDFGGCGEQVGAIYKDFKQHFDPPNS